VSIGRSGEGRGSRARRPAARGASATSRSVAGTWARVPSTRGADSLDGGAEEWLAFAPGLEGVVAKRCDGRYVPGQCDRVKVKRQRTVDCAVIGIAATLIDMHRQNPLTSNRERCLRKPGQNSRQSVALAARGRAGVCPVPPMAVCEVAYTLLDLLVARNCVLKPRLETHMSCTFGRRGWQCGTRTCRHRGYPRPIQLTRLDRVTRCRPWRRSSRRSW
jgi:hypothetical protein